MADLVKTKLDEIKETIDKSMQNVKRRIDLSMQRFKSLGTHISGIRDKKIDNHLMVLIKSYL